MWACVCPVSAATVDIGIEPRVRISGRNCIYRLDFCSPMKRSMPMSISPYILNTPHFASFSISLSKYSIARKLWHGELLRAKFNKMHRVKKQKNRIQYPRFYFFRFLHSNKLDCNESWRAKCHSQKRKRQKERGKTNFPSKFFRWDWQWIRLLNLIAFNNAKKALHLGMKCNSKSKPVITYTHTHTHTHRCVFAECHFIHLFLSYVIYHGI